MGYGGGVRQVCSTIYNIVLRVPAVIEDMNWHSQGRREPSARRV